MTFFGSNRKTALMKEDPIEPAPPMTQTDLPLISSESLVLLASMSSANMLTGREVTLSEMNLSRLNMINKNDNDLYIIYIIVCNNKLSFVLLFSKE